MTGPQTLDDFSPAQRPERDEYIRGRPPRAKSSDSSLGSNGPAMKSVSPCWAKRYAKVQILF
jgi:hypothetical protein